MIEKVLVCVHLELQTRLDFIYDSGGKLTTEKRDSNQRVGVTDACARVRNLFAAVLARRQVHLLFSLPA